MARASQKSPEPHRPTDRGLVAKIGLAVASAAVAVLIAEAAIRWLERPSIGRETPDTATLDLPALGFNTPAVPRSAVEGEFRVLGIGDSFAFGPVKYPFTYYSLAGDALTHDWFRQGASQTGRVRFVNLGEPGLSFPHYIDRYRYWGERIEHDAVVFTVYLGNDILDLALGYAPFEMELNQGIRQAGFFPWPPRRADRLPEKYPLRLLDHLRYRYLLWSGAVRPPALEDESPYHAFALQLDDERYHDLALEQLASFDPDQLTGLVLGYEEMLHFVRFVSALGRSGLPVAVLLAPHELQVRASLRAELTARFGVDPTRYDLGLPGFLIAETVARVDPSLPVLDLSKPFAEAAADGADLYFGTNSHWSVEGNRLAGARLADLLVETWSRPDAAREPAPAEVVATGHGHGPPSTARRRALEEFLEPLLRESLATAETVSARELSAFGRSGEPALYGIESVNGVRLPDSLEPDARFSVPQREAGFHLSGWAVDPKAESLAAAVFVEIAGRVYRAHYRLPRVDVARSLSNPRYRQSGFSLFLPRPALGPGPHTLEVLVLSGDGRRLQQGAAIPILIEPESAE